MNIGFDLDGIFINFPPLVPPKIINWLYRHSPKDLLIPPKTNNKLHYRIPRYRIEQTVRRLSHFNFLRPKMVQNISFLTKFPGNPHPHQLYLISSRYKFLENHTNKLLEKIGLNSPFSKVYLNTKNEQPHKFKERILKELDLDIYIDDDISLLRYLKNHVPKTKLFWYSPKSKQKSKFGIPVMTDLPQIKNYLPG